jgi:hypothetical protein
MIAADASVVELSPTHGGVAYITNGVAILRPIVRLPKESFLKAVVEVERRRAVDRAKMAGLAALMYGGDYDDTLPGQAFDMHDVLAPYAKDRDILKDLVYTFPGGNMADVKDPAKTELGYVPGPGGRAVIYLDGHVVWVPD